MPPMPEWLIPILQQFPVVGLVFGIVIVVVRWMDAGRKDEIARFQAEAAEVRRRADRDVARERSEARRAAREAADTVVRIEARHDQQLAALWARIRELEQRPPEDYE